MATPETPKADEGPAKDEVEDAVIVTDMRDTPSEPERETMIEPEAKEPEARTPEETLIAAEAQSDPYRSAPPVPPPARTGGAFALLLGGVLAAGAGFGLSRVVPEGWPLAVGGGADTSATLAAQSAEIAALKAALAELPAPADTGALSSRIDALQSALTTSTQEAGAAVAEANAKADAATASAAEAIARAEAAGGPAGKDLTPEIEALSARVAALEAAPPGTIIQGGDPAVVEDLRQELASLRAELGAQQSASAEAVDAVKASAAETVAAVEAAAAEAQAGVAAAQAEAETMRAAAEAESKATLLRAALARVQAGLESGAPFAAAVDELVAGGVTVPEALVAKGAGVPSLGDLQSAFPEAARAALAVSLKATAGDGMASRLGAFLRTQTGARSLEPREGDDPDAVLSRAEALVKDGQISAAVAEIAALPAEGKTAMGAWVALAQARLDAQAALGELAAAVGGQ